MKRFAVRRAKRMNHLETSDDRSRERERAGRRSSEDSPIKRNKIRRVFDEQKAYRCIAEAEQ